MFNHETYVAFLEDIVGYFCDRQYKKIFLIQDNASYHKHPDTYVHPQYKSNLVNANSLTGIVKKLTKKEVFTG